MTFDIPEKLAIVNVIEAVNLADGEVHTGELDMVRHLMEVIGFDSNFLIQARSLDTRQSIVILKKLPTDKKKTCENVNGSNVIRRVYP
ncbi:MAG: hypothetical protein WA810_07490 [Maribacter sp.]